MAIRFKCAMCRQIVHQDEELWLGDSVIHRNCEANFDERHGSEIARYFAPSTEAAAAGGGFDPYEL